MRHQYNRTEITPALRLGHGHGESPGFRSAGMSRNPVQTPLAWAKLTSKIEVQEQG